MAVIREHHHAAQMAVDHAAFLHVRGKKHELLAVAAPVHRQHGAAAVDRLLLRQNFAVRTEESDNPGVAPEVHGDELQSRQIGTELAYGGRLCVSYLPPP